MKLTGWKTKKQESLSLVYRNLFLYRMIVNVLYLGRYKERFKKVIALLDPAKDKSVVELCFGDVYIANWCKEKNIQYVGYDINQQFIAEARKFGINVECADIRYLKALPQSDVTIIMGSLYHFHDILDGLVSMVMSSSQRFIISEPIICLSSRNDFIGWLARRSANAGHGEEHFRYNKESLLAALEAVSKGRYAIRYAVNGREALVEIRKKNNFNDCSN